MRLGSGGEYKVLEHVQKVCVASPNKFHSCLCALKTCSYRVYRTAFILYSGHSHCILCHSHSSKEYVWSTNVTRYESNKIEWFWTFHEWTRMIAIIVRDQHKYIGKNRNHNPNDLCGNTHKVGFNTEDTGNLHACLGPNSVDTRWQYTCHVVTRGLAMV